MNVQRRTIVNLTMLLILLTCYNFTSFLSAAAVTNTEDQVVTLSIGTGTFDTNVRSRNRARCYI